jgi:hypothetical protein
MAHDVSLLCSRKPVPDPNLSQVNPFHTVILLLGDPYNIAIYAYILQVMFLLQASPTRPMLIPFSLYIRTTCPAHLIPLDLIARLTFIEELLNIQLILIAIYLVSLRSKYPSLSLSFVCQTSKTKFLLHFPRSSVTHIKE